MPTVWAPCPGKRNAVRGIFVRAPLWVAAKRESLVLGGREGFELLDDPLVQLDAHVLGRDADGVGDRAVLRRTVANDAHALDPKQRGTAEGAVVEAPEQALHRRGGPVLLHVQRADDLLIHHAHDELADALAA